MLRKRTLAVLFFLLAFFLVTSAVDFLHNHRSINEPVNCPAGQFLLVFLAAGAGFFTIHVFLVLLKTLIYLSENKYRSLPLFVSLSRSPPLV